MESMEDLLAEARRLHDAGMKQLAGIYFDKIPLPPGTTKEEVVEELKADILQMKALMQRYGWREGIDQA